jgi:enoyl-CoA hydratase/carnithine racemase
MPDLVISQFAASVQTLTLNMPELRNPISSPAMTQALIDAVNTADNDPRVRVVVLTGAGSAFSSGGDIRDMKSGRGLNDDDPNKTRLNYRKGIQRIPIAFDALEVPVIAAVNGPAIGAGFDLACMCDVRIAAESAMFAESFVKLGLIPGDGGAWFLPQVVGFAKAVEMALTGDAIGAQEALSCGLVTKVVPDNVLMDEARLLAQRIAANPRHSTRMAKRLMREGQGGTLRSVLELSAAMQALAHTQADHHEAVAAFLEKRRPVFSQ